MIYIYGFGLVVAVFGGFLITRFLDRLRKRDAETEAREIIRKAEAEVESRRREADLQVKEMTLQQQAENEKELRRLRGELHERERILDKRQDALEEQAEVLRKQEKMVESTQRKLTERIQDANRRKEELSKLLDLQRQTLHELSGLNHEEATRRLLELLDNQLQKETGAVILAHENRLAEVCEQKTRDALLTSIQRYAAAHTAESTTSTVGIPNDEMKGRIIGREGRNIRAFEKATGVDVIIDDTPGVVIVSAFDMIRREVARLSLEKLIADGRIHPTRIEEIVAGTQRELDRHIQKLGEQACIEADVHGLHERLVNLLGRLHFRTSYSQNVLRHSIEVAFIAGMLADETKFDGRLARRCGLLHDIGKAADHEAEGGHPKIGGRSPETLRRAARGDSGRHRAPRRPADRKPLHRARVGGRRLQRLAARRTPRNARTLRQADGGTGVDRRPLYGRRTGLRDSGRPRIAGDRQRQGDHRRIGRQNLPRHRHRLRTTTHLSRRDQSHRAAGDAARGDGEVVVSG